MPRERMRKKTGRIQLLRGMNDILPEDQVSWEKVRRIVERIAVNFDYKRIDTPIVEMAELFFRTVGEGTDIVEKEMYTFSTKGRDRVTLRPELTASIARAYIEHGMDRWSQPVKLYSIGPIFRYERPQKSRYRQSHQVDFEAFGRKDALLDVQMIQLAAFLVGKLGIKKFQLLINSIGCPKCRKPYIRSLTGYLKKNSSGLCTNCKKRLKKNPLRALDCKEEKCQAAISGAPQMINSLCDSCHSHFKEVLEYLDELDFPHLIDPSLVRGLDYYNRTVFEIVPLEKNGEPKKASLIGGGRYDGLIKQLGGKNTPGFGFAAGIERLLAEIPAKEEQSQSSQSLKNKRVFLVQLGDLGKKKSLKIFNNLCKVGIAVSESFGRGSITSQLKRADKIGARLALIIGQKEALDETVIIRDMEVGSQETVPQEKLIGQVKKILKKKR